MSLVTPKHGVYIIPDANINSIALDKPKEFFRKIWIWPGVFNPATGQLTANAATVYIGRDGFGPKCVPDSIATGDPAFPIALPDNANETMLLMNVLIKGTPGDGIFYTYWS